MISFSGNSFPDTPRNQSATIRTMAKVVLAGAIIAAPMAMTVETAEAAGLNWDSVAQCESGGNWASNTGNGYYGAYQFDSSTWDAYGDPAYAEANEAPQPVQDAAAAQVPYDAWPNC